MPLPAGEGSVALSAQRGTARLGPFSFQHHHSRQIHNQSQGVLDHPLAPYFVSKAVMEREALNTFRGYLRSLPEELLESVTADYVWLAGFPFGLPRRTTDFLQRRECCRQECLRRGAPQLYELAESVVSPYAA